MRPGVGYEKAKGTAKAKGEAKGWGDNASSPETPRLKLTVPMPPAEDPAVLSPLVAGVWRMGEWGQDVQTRLRWIEQCLDLGITSFDHADIYGDHTVEDLFGQALALAPGLRQRMQIVTKCGIRLASAHRPNNRVKHYDTSAAHVQRSVENSLRALRTEQIDLLLIHRPDALMDPDELAATFERLRASGKVRAFGASNHSSSQFALLHGRHRLVAHQIELSVLQMKALADGTLDQCLDLGVRPMVWSPLAGGRLFTDAGPQAQRLRAEMEAMASRLEVSLTTLAYAWIMRHPSKPHPITGTRRVEGLREACAALNLRLDAQDWYALWQASMGQPVP